MTRFRFVFAHERYLSVNRLMAIFGFRGALQRKQAEGMLGNEAGKDVRRRVILALEATPEAKEGNRIQAASLYEVNVQRIVEPQERHFCQTGFKTYYFHRRSSVAYQPTGRDTLA